ncbi:MAG: hypothetical protein PHR92_10145 [Lachnospiraceae bacterium]|nr:hypothetical protein [Lachnospiraceae bacterium]
MKRRHEMHNCWHFLTLSALFLVFLLGTGTAAQNTNIVAKVPSAHTVVINCGAGGSVFMDGQEYSGRSEFEVPRLNSFTLTIQPKEGYQFEAAWCNGQVLGISGSRLTISGVYADGTIYVSFCKKSGQTNEPGNNGETEKSDGQDITDASQDAAAESIVIDENGKPVPYEQKILRITENADTDNGTGQEKETNAGGGADPDENADADETSDQLVMVIRTLPEQNESGEFLSDAAGNPVYAARSLLLSARLLQDWTEQGYTQVWFVVKDAVLVLPLKQLKKEACQVVLTPLELQKELTESQRKLLKEFELAGPMYHAKITAKTEDGAADITDQIQNLRIRMLSKTVFSEKERQEMKLLLLPDLPENAEEELKQLDMKYITEKEASVWLEEILRMDETLTEEELQQTVYCFEAKLPCAGVTVMAY